MTEIQLLGISIQLLGISTILVIINLRLRDITELLGKEKGEG